MRGIVKTPGGKLVGVTVSVDGRGAVSGCRLDGDFFIDVARGDDAQSRSLVSDLERTLAACAADAPAAPANIGEHLSIWRAALARTCARYDGVRLVGTDAGAIALALARAMGFAPSGSVHATAADAAGRADTTDAGDWRTAVPDWRERWLELRPAVVHDIPRAPADQMAIDERWAREVAEGRRKATLRFWEWSSPAVVVGRFQSIDDEVHVDEAERLGFAVVRRCTGGGAMVARPGGTIAYSLYAPQTFVDGLSAVGSYRLCDGWLVDALLRHGVEARFQGVNDIAVRDGDDADAPWAKAGGAAQRRFPAPHGGGPGSVLHHTMLAYDLDGELMTRLLNTSAEKLSDKGVRSAAKRVSPLSSQPAFRHCGRERLVDALMRAASRWPRDCADG